MCALNGSKLLSMYKIIWHAEDFGFLLSLKTQVPTKIQSLYSTEYPQFSSESTQ